MSFEGHKCIKCFRSNELILITDTVYACLLPIVYIPQLENAQETALRKSDAVSATQDELSTTKVRVENLGSQLQLYQQEVGSLNLDGQDFLFSSRYLHCNQIHFIVQSEKG